MDPRFKDLVLQCLEVIPENRPTAEALIRHPFVAEFLDLNVDKHPPKVTNLRTPNNSREYINTLIEKVVDHVFDRKSFQRKKNVCLLIWLFYISQSIDRWSVMKKDLIRIQHPPPVQ